MAILVDKELIVTERQTLGGLRAVHETKNIHNSCDVQQSKDGTAPTKHDMLSLVVFTDAAATTGIWQTAYPSEKIGSEIKELIITGGVVAGAAMWLKTAPTVWTKLS